MVSDKVSIHGAWASRWVFILAATGSAVGLGFVLFAGWVLGREALREELAIDNPLLFGVLCWSIRVVAPLGILIVFVAELTK